MHDPIEIRHLRYFLAVAEAGSFSRAADRLGISQPSVSQQMRDLEMGLRVSLFQRRGKRILLTPTGLIFQEHARRGAECDRNVASLARAIGGGRIDAEDCVARKRIVEVESDPASRQKARAGDRAAASQGIGE